MKETTRSISMDLAVNTYDIDAAGHVNNIVYVRWLEDLRIKLATSLCDFRKLYDAGYYLVVTSTEIKYKRQIKLFDKPTGVIGYLGHKHGVLYLKAEILLNGKIAASAYQKCIVFDMKNSCMIPDNKIDSILSENRID